MSDSGVRLTEVLVALSLATDLGLGQPAEHMARSARISMRLGERLGLDDRQLATLYDVSVLTYVGCPVYGNEAATIFGDDIAFRREFAMIDRAGLPAMSFVLRRAGAESPVLRRVRLAAGIMATGGRGVAEQMANHCAAVGELASRLGLSSDVREGLEQSYARWDGRGVPSHLARDQLSLSARICHVAEACEVLQRSAGVDEAVGVVRERRGGHFDPSVVEAVERHPTELFDGIDEHTVDELLEADPLHRPPLTHGELDVVLAAVGDFCDLRCTYFAGHSRGTAELVSAACELLSVPATEAVLARRAALVHDVGRFGVSATVWDRPGPLASADQERMRMHAYYVERIFSRPPPLRNVGVLAATHHERMDGSGYHRGLGGTTLSLPARVLAAADAYHAMTQRRPHRPALTDADAARELRKQADEGRFDPTATDAVLSAAGQAGGRTRAGGPAGLTAREGDVLALLAQGLANKAIARHLRISPKTTGNHVERIYAKLGVTNRAAATMRAVQHGLVGTGPAPMR